MHPSSPLHSSFSQLSTKGDTLLLGTNRAFPVNIMPVVFAKPAHTHLYNLQRLSLFFYFGLTPFISCHLKHPGAFLTKCTWLRFTTRHLQT